MITFRPILITLFSRNFILVLKIYLSFIDLLYDLADTSIDLLICLDFFCRIDEEDVCASSGLQGVLLLTPALADPALEEIAFDSSFEHLLRNRNHDPVGLGTRVCHIQKPEPGNIPVLPLGKKLPDCGLAAESLLLGKGVRYL